MQWVMSYLLDSVIQPLNKLDKVSVATGVALAIHPLNKWGQIDSEINGKFPIFRPKCISLLLGAAIA